MAGTFTPAALGFRTHTGWAVALCLGGPTDAPVVLERRRLVLTDPSLPFEPFHAARGLAQEQAEALISRATEVARQLALQGVRAVARELEAKGYEIVGGGITISAGRPDFTLSQALSSHAGTHNAEGWLYRNAVILAVQECGHEIAGIIERDCYEELAPAIGIPGHDLRTRVSELGRAIGPPWRQDEKAAAMVAWLALLKARLPAA